MSSIPDEKIPPENYTMCSNDQDKADFKLQDFCCTSQKARTQFSSLKTEKGTEKFLTKRTCFV